VVRSSEKPVGEAEGECQPEDRSGCLSGAGLYDTGITGRENLRPSMIPFIMNL